MGIEIIKKSYMHRVVISRLWFIKSLYIICILFTSLILILVISIVINNVIFSVYLGFTENLYSYRIVFRLDYKLDALLLYIC